MMPDMNRDTIPTAGREAAPESPSDPEESIEFDEDRGTITRREESGVGPGAGESAVVRVTVPVQSERERSARHPTLREGEQRTEEDGDESTHHARVRGTDMSKANRKAKAETLLEDSKTEEEHPEIDPQSPGSAVRKLEKEAAEGGGVVDKAKRAVEEVDRQISGEYERREQPE